MAYRPTYPKGPVSLTITASVRSPDIRALAISAGWIGFELLYCTVPAGVDVAALNISNIPHDLLTLIVRGRIGGTIGGAPGIYTRIRIKIDNAGGTIFGVGGRGGNGGSWLIRNPNAASYMAAGDGGSGGAGAAFSASGSVELLAARPGDSGRTEALSGPSVGGLGSSTGGSGGSGGNIGQAGSSGQSGSASGNYTLVQVYQPTDGQPAGNYVDGNAFVTWLAPGSRLGNAI